MNLAPLNEDGYALAPEIFSPEQVKELIGVMERVQENLDPAQSNYGIRHILQVPELLELAHSTALLGLIQQLLGTGARPVRGIFFDKTPDANWKVPWHQDLTIAVKNRCEVAGFTAWSMKEAVWHVQPPLEFLENMVTARLHLDECGSNNGPLQVIPRSHLAGRLTAEQIRAIRERNVAVTCTAKPGDLLLMRPLLLHASSAAQIAMHRRVIHIEYASADLPSGLEWHL